MTSVSAVIVGAGQAGLATSQVLTRAGVDHVVLERGVIGNSWRTERWSSLRLLTPNWMTRLPGGAYAGDDPDGYMRALEFATLLEDYARAQKAPVLEQTPVVDVRRDARGFQVATDRATFRTWNVVVCTGAASRPRLPRFHREVPPGFSQLSPLQYKDPTSVVRGGVLIVGASASGVQLADELSRAGRAVTLCVGRHTRLPRRYHGRDTLWWLDRLGRLSKPVPAGHHEPSLQVVGSDPPRDLDLGYLQRQGVRVLGRALGIDRAGALVVDGGLAERVAAADRRLCRLLDRIDAAAGLPGVRPAPLALDAPATRLDLRAEGIETIVWATGVRPHFPWLNLSTFRDARGTIDNHGGITAIPGLYLVGMPNQLRRNSAQIDGVGFIARRVGTHIARALHTHPRSLALAS